MSNDLIINDLSLKAALDLIFKSVSISTPKPILNILSIPGTSSVLDLSEAISGDIEYDQRNIKIILESMCGKQKFYSMHAKLCNLLHGRKVKIIFSPDSAFYWTGRLSVDDFSWKGYGGTVTLTGTVDPYKYETQSSLTPWLWDPFNFSDGIIRNYYDLPVPGSLTIIGRRKRVCPKFICSTGMTVSYLGNSYTLTAGSNVIPDIFLGEGDHVLTFIGSGTVSVDYQGASL